MRSSACCADEEEKRKGPSQESERFCSSHGSANLPFGLRLRAARHIAHKKRIGPWRFIPGDWQAQRCLAIV